MEKEEKEETTKESKKEKKPGKDNRILYCIISLLLLIILGMGIYIACDKGIIFSNSDTKEENKNSSSKDESEEPEEDSNANEESSNEAPITNKMSNDEALAIGNKLWTYAYDAYWGNEAVWKRHTGEANEYGGRPIICDTTINDVKASFNSNFSYEMVTCQTNNCLSTNLNAFLQGQCQGAGRGSKQDYQSTTLSIKNIEENKITFTATSTYSSSSTLNKDFIIEKNNSNWLISYFFIPA